MRSHILNGLSVRRGRSSGFTLVEVMVAVAIVGIALPALMFQVMKQADHSGYLREKTLAYWLAENQVTRLRLQKQLTGSAPTKAANDEAMMLGIRWYWRIEPEKTVQGALFRYKVSVGRDRDNNLALLETYLSE